MNSTSIKMLFNISLCDARMNTTSKLDQYVEVLRETYGMKGNVAEDVMKRLSVLLCNLIKQTLHQRDILDSKLGFI